jgi:hypothetical protein
MSRKKSDPVRIYRKRNRKQLAFAYAFLEKWVNEGCPFCDLTMLNTFLMLVDADFRADILKRQSALLTSPSARR